MKQHRSLTRIKWRRMFAAAIVLAVALSTPVSALRSEQNQTALNEHKMLFNKGSIDGFEESEKALAVLSSDIAHVTDQTVAERYASELETGVLTGDNLFSAMTQEGRSSAVIVPYTDLFGQKYTQRVKGALSLGPPPEGNRIFAQHLLIDSSEKLVMDMLTFTQNESKDLVIKYMETRNGKRIIKEMSLNDTGTMFSLSNAEIDNLNVTNPPPGFMLNLADDTAFKSIYVNGDTLLSVNGTFNELNIVRGAAYIASRGNGTLNVTTARARAALDEQASLVKANFVTRSTLLGDNWGDTLVGPYIDPTEVENKSTDDNEEEKDFFPQDVNDREPSTVPPTPGPVHTPS